MPFLKGQLLIDFDAPVRWSVGPKNERWSIPLEALVIVSRPGAIYGPDEVERPIGGPRFDGSDYSPARDDARLTAQLGRIADLMLDGGWRTLQEIAESTGDPPTSISAQLRHLRKPRFGSHTVDKRRRGESDGLYEYRVLFRARTR